MSTQRPAAPEERNSRRRSMLRGALVTALAAGLLWVVWERPARARLTSPEEPVKRGEYLVTIGGCHDCHTPWVMGPNGPEPDMTRKLSGHPADIDTSQIPELPEGPWEWVGAGTNTAYAGPWGVSYARNLTPDENTGIGVWTEEIFVNTIRSGRHWGVARPILPPMPWQNYRQMSDDDLKAVYAYLRSLPPVYNPVPESQPAQVQ